MTMHARRKKKLRGIVASLTVALLAIGTPLAAAAAEGDGDVGHQIELRWKAGTPALDGNPVKTGNPVTAETRINVNSTLGAPDNEPVDNVVVTYTLNEFAKFTAIPSVCLIDGVDPASSISADARTLVCNIGTQINGTAVALDIPVVADGRTGDVLTVDATVTSDAEHGSATATTIEHEIISPFTMDMDWTDPAGNWTSTDHMTHRSGFQFTLYAGKGVTAGPNSITYDVTLTPQEWGNIDGKIDSVVCRPYTNTAITNGHPYTVGASGAPADSVVASPASCTLTTPVKQANGTYLVKMTISGLAYNEDAAPTRASNGDALRTDMYAVAGGELYITQSQTYMTDGQVVLDANAPTYSDGTSTYVDDTANNHAEKGWTRPGGWNSWWLRWHTRDGGDIQDGSYWVTPGTQVRQQSVMSGPNSNATDQWALDQVPNPTLGLCTILDRQFTTFDEATSQTYPIWGTVGTEGPLPGTFSYFVDSSPSTYIDITRNVNNRSMICADFTSSQGYWTSDISGVDPAHIQAVDFKFKRDDARNVTAELIVLSTIKADAPIGQDVWQVSGWHMGAPWNLNLGTGYYDTTALSTAGWNPPARFPSTNIQRDVLRIASALPTIKKSTPTPAIEAVAGTAADFRIEFTAQSQAGSGGPATADNYVVRDVLPAGMTYVDGSVDFPGADWLPAASRTPQITMENGQQVLTWTLNGVPIGVDHPITYQATLDADADSGQTFTNTAYATLNGRTVQADATVTATQAGLTVIGKSANQQLIPNDGGVGEGSWTVTLRSLDGKNQTFTDVIDILPYNGDPRGSNFSGSFELTSVDAPGQTVYYTTEPVANLNDDPTSTINGQAGSPSAIWSTTKPAAADITAVRVIGGAFAYAETRAFTITITTEGAKGGDVYVNRAQARASHTELVMRTSDLTTMSQFYGFYLKKYVKTPAGDWVDAQDTNPAEWPLYLVGDDVEYKFTLTNTGEGTLNNIEVTDPMFGNAVLWTQDTLAPGETVDSPQTWTHTVTATDGEPHELGTRIQNTANAHIPDEHQPTDSTEPVPDSEDPANVIVPAVVSVGDYVWLDTNRDGIQDAGEAGIEGVVLTLVGPDGNPVTDVFGNPVGAATTDANGGYVFENLPVLAAGQSYTVSIDRDASADALVGLAPTQAEQGGDTAKDSSTWTAASGDLSVNGASDMTLDFGFVPVVSVGDYVWIDTNRDGLQDSGEPGLAGVVLVLTGPDGNSVTGVDGNPVGPATTNTDGKYIFENLPPLPAGESYTVSIDRDASASVLTGYVPTTEGAGSDRADDSSTWTADSGDVSTPGASDLTLDFGFVPAVSVGDYVWIDANRDGLQDAGEQGIAGVVLTLFDPRGNPVIDVFGNPVGPITTDANGKYLFENLPVLAAGESYTVSIDRSASEAALEGYLPTLPNVGGDRAVDSSDWTAKSGDLTTAGAADLTLDFGFVPVVSVGDYVWIDADGDGIQDAGEPPLPGVVLTLTGPDGNPVVDVYGNPVEPVTTDSNGTYEFPNLPMLEPGQTYTVTVSEVPAGYIPTVPGAGDDRGADSSTGSAPSGDLSTPGASDPTLDFGFVPVVSVGDFVWLDDGDGIQEAGEPGIAGVVLVLTGPDGNPVTDVFGNPVGPVTTDANGLYVFENLPVLEPGQSYTVRIDADASQSAIGHLIPTQPGAGDDRAVDSSTDSATSSDLSTPGASDMTLDFGFVAAVSVGDYVWLDVNHDGRQDDAEPGIPGVVLTLTGPDGGPVTDVFGNPVGPVTTDQNGEYVFPALPVLADGQSYTVHLDRDSQLDVLGTYMPTLDSQGDREGDSSTDSASSEGLTVSGQSDMTLDFGFVATAPAIDIEKYDAEGNDADTAADRVLLPAGETTALTFTVKNLGNEPLVNVTVSDAVTSGDQSVADLSCVFPDGSTGTTWAGPLDAGAQFDCTAELTAPVAGANHADIATVTGAGKFSGTPVTDEDEYHGYTPNPSISIVKRDAAGNDANTSADAVRTTESTVQLRYVVTNTGDEALRNVAVADLVTAGSATVEGMVCTFPDGSTGLTWVGEFAVGDSFECQATLRGLVNGEHHTDVAAVKATGVDSGVAVSDDDPYNAIRNTLASTGVTMGIGAVVALVLLVAGGGLILARRRHSVA